MIWLKNVRFAWKVGLLVLCSLPLAGMAAMSSPTIDQSIALKVGDYSVSQYLVSKYYGRYSDGIRQQQHRAPSAAESMNWLLGFVAKQCIIAYARSEGYADRPEVRNLVDRMERHMLTQSYGPYYEELLSNEPAKTKEESDALYFKIGKRYDAVVAHFADQSQAVAVLGTDFERLPLEEQGRRVEQYKAVNPPEVMEGQITWPFFPFIEIAEEIVAAPEGHWINVNDKVLGVYYILNRSVQESGRPLMSKEAFLSLQARVREQKFQKRRHSEILAKCHFQCESATAGRLLEICSSLHSESNEIGDADIQTIAEKPLFHYRIGNNLKTISVGEFCQHFNAGFVRSIPRSLPLIVSMAEDMAVEDHDYRDAKAVGIDQLPKFKEDRAGFAGFQILDVYEKAVLIPKLDIKPDSIQHYYDEHVLTFSVVSKFNGRRIEFPTLENAVQWKQSFEAKGNPSKPTVVSGKDELIEVNAATGVAGLEPLRDIIAHSPEGAVIGPINLGPPYVCFIKGKSLETTVRPFASVSAEIRGILMREALEREELAVGQDLAKRLGLEDHINYNDPGRGAEGRVAAGL